MVSMKGLEKSTGWRQGRVDSFFRSSKNAWLASSGSWPEMYPESFRVSLVKGEAIAAKFGMVLRKKLHRPRNCLICVMSVGEFH